MAIDLQLSDASSARNSPAVSGSVGTWMRLRDGDRPDPSRYQRTGVPSVKVTTKRTRNMLTTRISTPMSRG
jgi:hypothetical protein